MGTNPGLFDRFRAAEDRDQVATKALLVQAQLSGKTVLEVGCGTGILTELLVTHAHCVIGLERAWTAAAHGQAKPRVPGVIVGDALHPPFQGACVDAIIGGWVFAYLSHSERPAGLKRLGALLRPHPTAGLWAIENHWDSEIQHLRGRGGRMENSEVSGLLELGFEIRGEAETAIEFDSPEQAHDVLSGLIGTRADQELTRFPRARFGHRLLLLHCPAQRLS